MCREEPIRLTALAAKEGVSQPSMTQLIQRLERLGLVTRLADPDDGRAALIGITGRAKAARRPEANPSGTPDGVIDDADVGRGMRLWLSARVALPVLRRLVANADRRQTVVRRIRPGQGKSRHDRSISGR